jgi:hypothetical protein
MSPPLLHRSPHDPVAPLRLERGMVPKPNRSLVRSLPRVLLPPRFQDLELAHRERGVRAVRGFAIPKRNLQTVPTFARGSRPTIGATFMRTLLASMLAAGLFVMPSLASAQTTTEPQTKEPAAKAAPAPTAKTARTTNKGVAAKSKPSKGTHAYVAKKRVSGRHVRKMRYAKRHLRRSVAYRSYEGRTKRWRAHGYRSQRSEGCQ